MSSKFRILDAVSHLMFEKKSSTRFLPPKHRVKVTGLGLSISHNIIVQKHKGEIAVYSNPGETRFEVKLPISFR